MNVVAAITAGLIATAVMTLLMYVAPKMGMPKMDIIGMLGTMFMEKSTGAYILGTIIHFMMGAIFAIIYAWIWANWFGEPTWLWGLVFGAIHGVIAIIVMPMMMKMHPRPPEMEMGPMLMMGMMIGHLVYGLVVALTYAAIV